jgi:hypothetical protein
MPGNTQWPTDGSLPPDVIEFVEWLVSMEKTPSTLRAWASEHGYAERTVYSWKKDRRVRRAIEERCDEVNLSPDRVQEVINAVFKAATQGDMKAAQLYLQHADKLAPKRIVVEDRTLSQLSDEELREQMVAAGIFEEN